MKRILQDKSKFPSSLLFTYKTCDVNSIPFFSLNYFFISFTGYVSNTQFTFQSWPKFFQIWG